MSEPRTRTKYTYDPVGNRTQKVSTLPGYPGGLTNYNANDQISTGTYDADGNTTASNGTGYVYDFENRLVQAGGGITIVYDGDGNRVSKTVAGVTTSYLVDTQNPTGYAQVVYEATTGSSSPNREQSHTFSYGLELVNEARTYISSGQLANSTIYFDYDGHGSVRALTDSTGTVTDTYDYDAFGNLIHSTGTSYNNYLFAGEQFDPDLNLYYNRARYLNVSTGRFWSMDTYEGVVNDPLSLHKYMYADQNPVSARDPSGHDPLVDALAAVVVVAALVTFTAQYVPVLRRGGLLKLQFENEFIAATKTHAAGIGLFPGGNIGDLVDGPCVVWNRFVDETTQCYRGCLAWEDWTEIWFDTTRKAHGSQWSGIALKEYHYWHGFMHNFVGATFPSDTPVILDPWRDPDNPVWEQSLYIMAFGAISEGKRAK